MSGLRTLILHVIHSFWRLI